MNLVTTYSSTIFMVGLLYMFSGICEFDDIKITKLLHSVFGYLNNQHNWCCIVLCACKTMIVMRIHILKTSFCLSFRSQAGLPIDLPI